MGLPYFLTVILSTRFIVWSDTDGCFIIMDTEVMNERITLANVYGPSAGDNPGFFWKNIPILSVDVCECIQV